MISSQSAKPLAKIEHFVVVMLENRWFDHILGNLYAKEGNVSPLGHPFDGLTGEESNEDQQGRKSRSGTSSRATLTATSLPRPIPAKASPTPARSFTATR